MGGEGFGEVAVGVFEVAFEHGAGVGVFAGVDHLGDVDDPGVVVVPEEVVGGEVAVDAVVGEEAADGPEDAVPGGEGLLGGEADTSELGGGLGGAVEVVAEEFHDDGVAFGVDDAGDVEAEGVEFAEVGGFHGVPHAEGGLLAEFGAVVDGAADASGKDDAAFAVGGVVAEMAVFEGAVDLDGEESAAEAWAGAAGVDGGFLAGFEDGEDVGDEALIEVRGDGFAENFVEREIGGHGCCFWVGTLGLNRERHGRGG